MSEADIAFAAGMFLYEQARRQEAVPFLLTAASKYREQANAERECQALVTAGEALRMLNRIDEASEFLERAAEIAERKLSSEHASTRASVLLTYGNYLTNLGRIEEALRYHRKAVDQAQHLDDPDVKSNAYFFLAETLLRANQDDSARRPLTLAAYYARCSPYVRTKCNAFHHYGELLRREDKLERAGYYLEKAAQLSLQQPDLHLRCICCRDFGSISGEIRWLKEAAEIARGIEDAHTACNAFVAYARALGEAESLEWLRRAAAKLSEVRDPHTRLMVQQELIEVLFRRGHWTQVLNRSLEAVADLLTAMQHNPFVDGLAVTAQSPVVPYGVYAADQLQRTHPDLNAMSTALMLLDAVKCVQIREGLRRHIEGTAVNGKSGTWSGGPATWRQAFAEDWVSNIEAFSTGEAAPGTDVTPADRALVRGDQSGHRTSRGPVDRLVLELPAQPTIRKNAFCDPQQLHETTALLPDERTLVLYFAVVLNDILILPMHLISGQALVLEGGAQSLIWIRDVVPALRELAVRQNEEINEILRPASQKNLSLSQLLERSALPAIYQQAFGLLNGAYLLDLLRRRVGPLEDWHVVIIPDGPLYELPLHALVVDGHSRRLYECFQSLRYALSLKTLSLQAAVQRTVQTKGRRSGLPRVCIFANPDREVSPLPQVVAEAGMLIELLEAFPGAQWRLHGDTAQPEFRATRHNFERWHGRGNLLWACGHGLESEDVIEGKRVVDLALLLCDEEAVGPSRFIHDPYDFTGVELFVVSACMLGKVSASRPYPTMVRAFNATLALRGCQRVTSALWELLDRPARIFASKYMQAILEHAFGEQRDDHSYARAYSDALRAFRQHDGGRFDHEFFWAPYTFYGLG